MQKEKDIFLVAHYYMKPNTTVNTTKAGWKNDPNNVQWDETVEITRGTKKNAIDAKIVLNLSKKEVVRDSISNGRSFDQLFCYFFEGYSQYMTTVMKQIDSGYLLQTLDKMQREIDEQVTNEQKEEQQEETDDEGNQPVQSIQSEEETKETN